MTAQTVALIEREHSAQSTVLLQLDLIATHHITLGALHFLAGHPVLPYQPQLLSDAIESNPALLRAGRQVDEENEWIKALQRSGCYTICQALLLAQLDKEAPTLTGENGLEHP